MTISDAEARLIISNAIRNCLYAIHVDDDDKDSEMTKEDKEELLREFEDVAEVMTKMLGLSVLAGESANKPFVISFGLPESVEEFLYGPDDEDDSDE